MKIQYSSILILLKIRKTPQYSLDRENKKFIFLLTMLVSYSFAISQNLETITKEKPITISGSINTNIGYYNSTNFNNTMKPFTYSISAAPTISILNSIHIPFNFVLNQGSTSVSDPFYQIGINPYYKGWKGYFGWTNMTWGDYVLNGKTFLGVGSDLQLGILRVGGMYGRFNPSVQRDTTKKYFENSQFTRSGYAFRLGLGTEKNHTDLMMLRAHDHIESIPSDENSTSPQANFVLGLKNLQTFLGGKIIWSLEAAAEAHTRDLRGKNYEYDTTISLLNTLNSFIPLKYSTSYAWAGKTKLDYRGKYLGLGVEFFRVQPEYITFGTDYMMNDQQRLTFKESFRTKNSKMNFVLSQSYQTDNLTNKKAVTTGRWNTNNLWNFNPNQRFGLTLSYGLFIIEQNQGNKFLSDSVRLFQFNHNAMFSPRYTIVNEKGSHNFSMTLMYQGMKDENEKSKYRIDGNTFNVNLNHNYFINKSQWNINSGLNYLNVSNNAISFSSFGPTLGLSKSFIDNKMNASYTFSYLHNIQDGVFAGNTVTNSLNASYTIDKHHSLRYNFNLMLGTVNANTAQNELRTDLGYSYSF